MRSEYDTFLNSFDSLVTSKQFFSNSRIMTVEYELVKIGYSMRNANRSLVEVLDGGFVLTKVHFKDFSILYTAFFVFFVLNLSCHYKSSIDWHVDLWQ